MSVTRAVVTDLLPIYFSGEASADTKALIEDYFRQDPDFERIARSAAAPLETLQAAAPIAAGAEKEKRDLESVRWGLRRRILFSMALFVTLVPLVFHFTNGHIVWLMFRDEPWDAAYYWGMAALFWFLYSARLHRRTAFLVGAIFFTLLPLLLALHFVSAGGPESRDSLLRLAEISWITAAFAWLGYFRQRRR